MTGRDLLVTAAPTPPVARHGASGVARIFYALAALGALFGTFELIFGLGAATGAPQQGAIAAMAAAYAILPYVMARAVDELTR